MKELSSENIIKILKKISQDNNKEFSGKLQIGDIVFDKTNKEYGILLSIKPEAICNNEEVDKILSSGKVVYSTAPQIDSKTTAVLLTISKNDKSWLPKDSYAFRVRYTKLNKISFIEKNSLPKKTSSVSDLEYHCNNECFLECSKECSLWKYKKDQKN